MFIEVTETMEPFGSFAQLRTLPFRFERIILLTVALVFLMKITVNYDEFRRCYKQNLVISTRYFT